MIRHRVGCVRMLQTGAFFDDICLQNSPHLGPETWKWCQCNYRFPIGDRDITAILSLP